jgi:serine phosphatase RsbU (regulator of sigma subunit)/tetratricopeptide (TPR) repeat protein
MELCRDLQIRAMSKAAAYLLTLACLVLIVPCTAQDDDLLSNVMRSDPGKERAVRLVDLSVHERKAGRLKEAVEFAILASTEAERHGAHQELGRALLELAQAHQAKGDLDNAIGASIRATLIHGIYHGTLRTDALIQLAELYNQSGHPQKALEHLEHAANSTSAARMNRTRYLRAEAMARKRTMKPEAMIDHCNRIMEEVVKSGDRALLLEITSMLASAQAQAGRHLDALTTEEQVLKLAIALDKPFHAAVSTNNLGELNHRMGRSQEALISYGKGLIMVEDVPALRLNMQINAAHAHARSGDQDAANRLLTEARALAEREEFNAIIPRLLRTQAAVHMLQGDMATAQNEALEALGKAEELGDLAGQALACDMLAVIFERRDLDSEARTFRRKARDIEQRSTVAETQRKSEREAHLLQLQRVEREQTDLLNREQRKEQRLKQLALDAENREKQFALLMYEKQLEESARREALMAQEQATKELLLTQAELEQARQERMIQELDNNRMLQSLSLSQLELEQKEQQRAMDLLEQRNELVEARSRTLTAQQLHDQAVKRYYILMAAAGLLLAAYMAWAWNITRRKKRTIWLQHQQIQGINTELEEKNSNIQSSLSYAQTIQSAILPTENDIQQAIPESFLLYKPLETVSGDLPFVKEVGNRIYVAAIDCTGHGVPAAMMTFIAYYGLNELITKHPDAHSGVILDRLHEHVKQTMSARGDASLYNDGFDIGLCIIDRQEGTLSYSGAQLPLVMVRNNEASRIKGDILPLGDAHLERSTGYTEHHLQLTPGDSIFLFSDGIIHQFGGKDGKRKFSMKQLMEVLGGTSAMNLVEVKEQAARTFMEWKGETPQTDDVLMIGFRYAA